MKLTGRPTVTQAEMEEKTKPGSGGISRRRLILHRYGGLGGQRYPLGFSGDVKVIAEIFAEISAGISAGIFAEIFVELFVEISVFQVSWASLAFQPKFTAAAANVNFGWWSHDIGGTSL